VRQQDHEAWKTSSPTVTQHSDRPPCRTPVHSKFRPLFINPRLGIVRLWVTLANVRLRSVRRTVERSSSPGCEVVIGGALWHSALGFLYCHPQRWERRGGLELFGFPFVGSLGVCTRLGNRRVWKLASSLAAIFARIGSERLFVHPGYNTGIPEVPE
jgi:hypothetical protein